MRTRTTLILFSLTVAVACWIIFHEKDRPNTEEANRRGQNVLNFETDQLEGLMIRNGDDKIDLRKVEGKWRLESPIKDQADAALIESMLASLESWPKDRTISAQEIESNKGALAEYDLEKPKLRLKLLGKEMPPELLFGKDAALEGKMYVRFENSKNALIARNTIRVEIAKKPEEFRDRKLTDITAAQVTRLVLKTPAGEIEAQKQGQAWELVKPLRARGDLQKIGDLIAQVTSARIERFVAEETADLQPFGLAEPRGALTLFTQDNTEGQMLQLGGPAEGEQVHVRFSARKFVSTLPKKIEEILKTTPADLRDRHLVRVESDMLDRITIDAPGKSKTVLARKEQAWTLASQDHQPANATEVTRLIDALKNEHVTRFVEDVASDLPKYGLDQPQLIVTLSSFASGNTAETKAGEHPFATIAFGKVEGDNVFARIGEEPFVVAVRRSFLEGIFTDPAQWRDLAIFKFKPEDVTRFTVATDKMTAITRGPNKEWIRAEGNGPINQVNAQSLVNTLAKLRAVRWHGGTSPPPAFEQPQITLEFATAADEKRLHKVVIGGPAGDGMWFGRVEGRDGAFVLSNPDFNALRLQMAEAAPVPAQSPAASPTPSSAP